MAFELPPLPYDYAALEPHIDEQTMRIHHGKHHQTYVDKANEALAGTEWEDAPVEEVLSAIDPEQQKPLRNNAGGHANHSLFWTIMSPNGGGEPDGELRAAIDDAFGDFASLRQTVVQNGVGQFGSGWSWVVWNSWRSRPTRRRIRVSPRSCAATTLCWASTSGSTRTTCATRTAGPTTSTPGGTWCTGTRSLDGSSRPAAGGPARGRGRGRRFR